MVRAPKPVLILTSLVRVGLLWFCFRTSHQANACRIHHCFVAPCWYEFRRRFLRCCLKIWTGYRQGFVDLGMILQRGSVMNTLKRFCSKGLYASSFGILQKRARRSSGVPLEGAALWILADFRSGPCLKIYLSQGLVYRGRSRSCRDRGGIHGICRRCAAGSAFMQLLIGCVQERLAARCANMFYKVRSCERGFQPCLGSLRF